eukprot:747097-Hanusia_phi.AAC.7
MQNAEAGGKGGEEERKEEGWRRGAREAIGGEEEKKDKEERKGGEEERGGGGGGGEEELSASWSIVSVTRSVFSRILRLEDQASRQKNPDLESHNPMMMQFGDEEDI